MATTTRPYPWLSIARILALIALFLVVLVAVLPASPEWLLPVAVAVLAIAILLG